VLHEPAGGQTVIYHLRHDATKIEADVTFRVGGGQELNIGLSLRNRGSETRLVKAAFPLLAGVGWGSECRQDYCLYPYGTGAILNRPVTFLNGYGGGQTYLQMMAVYAPALGGGAYLRVNDQSGEYKVLHLTKADEQTDDPSFAFQELRVDLQNDRAEHDLVLFKPYEATPGVSMAFSYWGRRLEPNQSWLLPVASLGVFNGDWRAAMEAYREWFESFSRKRPHPSKLVDCFNHEGIGHAHYHDKNGYNTDVNHPGRIWPVWGPEKLKKYISKTPDLLEHASYWEWDEVEARISERGLPTRDELAKVALPSWRKPVQVPR
jgi:hypothetical protein